MIAVSTRKPLNSMRSLLVADKASTFYTLAAMFHGPEQWTFIRSHSKIDSIRRKCVSPSIPLISPPENTFLKWLSRNKCYCSAHISTAKQICSTKMRLCLPRLVLSFPHASLSLPPPVIAMLLIRHCATSNKTVLCTAKVIDTAPNSIDCLCFAIFFLLECCDRNREYAKQKYIMICILKKKM